MPVNGEELFDIVNDDGVVIGTAPRAKCHGDPSLIHRTAHVVVLHPAGTGLLLQLRSKDKDIQPGKWDTAVGGHLDHGEDYETAALRELSEELGVRSPEKPRFLFDSKIRNAIESENTRVFAITAAGPFQFQRSEIDAVRFWSWSELRDALAAGGPEFTPNLIVELQQLSEIGLIPKTK